MIHGSSEAQTCAAFLAAQGWGGPDLRRPPDLQEPDQASHRHQRGEDVDDPRVDIVRHQELRDREGHAGNQDRRPDRDHAAEAGEGPDQPERHDQRKERQLPSDHGAEDVGVDAGDAGEAGDRRAEGAEGDRGRIGDEREAGGRERREAEPDQDRAGDRNRSAEAGRALEKGAEGEGDKQQLQAAVVGDAADRDLQRLERALLDCQPIEKDDVEDDPADREEAGHHAEHRRAQRQSGRHGEDNDGDEIGDDQRDDGGDVGLDLARRDQGEQRDDWESRGDRRKNRVVERVVDLVPHERFPRTRCRRGVVPTSERLILARNAAELVRLTTGPAYLEIRRSQNCVNGRPYRALESENFLMPRASAYDISAG
jgi:hypothetical protein